MQVTPKSRQAWRTWLTKNHDSRSEVWLVFYKRGTGKPTLSYGAAVEEAICFGWIDGLKRSIDAERYTHRFSPRRPNSRWSESNRKRAQAMEKSGLMTAAGRKSIAAAKRNGTWNAATETVDASVPPELAERLRRNRRAATHFESLTPSEQRQFCLWINVAKRPDTKARRLDETLDLLARGEKLGMR